jgi:hypothetical protein
MRQGQQNKRMRGRNRKGPNPLTRSYESNGGDVKLRGTALHIAEKYVQLARDSQSSGDRVAAENYFQHAEHYYRIVAAAQAQMPQPQPIIRSDDDDMDEEGEGEFRINGNVPGPGGERPMTGGQAGGQGGGFGLSDPQPFLNGAAENDDEGNDGYPQRDNGNGYAQRDNNTRDSGNGGAQRFQGHPQGQQRQGEGQGHYRGRRRPFRDRYDNRDNRDRSAGPQGGGGGGERSDRPADVDNRPESTPEPSDD